MRIFGKTVIEIWTDPVWSKVISATIIGTAVLIGTAVSTTLLSLDFTAPTGPLPLPIWVTLVIVSLLVAAIVAVIKFRKKKSSGIENEVSEKEKPKTLLRPLIFSFGTPRHFLSSRISSAFPGIRNGVKWFKGADAVHRLSILLAEPLVFRFREGGEVKPLWWFRGGSSMHIDRFLTLSKNKCLLGTDELSVEKIAVHVTSHEFQNFIYVQARAESPVYYSKADIERHQKNLPDLGFVSEEYALFKGKPIPREHYDDGATMKGGKVIPLNGLAELRHRYLTSYNFIITSVDSPYNSGKFDRESREIMNGLLTEKVAAKAFFEFMLSFTKDEVSKKSRRWDD